MNEERNRETHDHGLLRRFDPAYVDVELKSRVNDSKLSEWFQALLAAANADRDHSEVIHDAYQQLENAGLISKVTVHRYLCHRCGKPCATVIRLGDKTIARTRDYKFSPGLNIERSVEAARAGRTLDGNRHWPGHTYDVDELAKWGLGFDVNCRHKSANVRAVEVLEITRGVAPGHPGKPTMF